MTDPLDTIEAILDQHPPDTKDWTNKDVGAHIHASEMLIIELETTSLKDRERWKRLERLTKRMVLEAEQVD